MVSSMNIKLSGEQLRSVIRAIDLDGGGFIDFPEFEAAVKRHEEVNYQYQNKKNDHIRSPYSRTPFGLNVTFENAPTKGAICSSSSKKSFSNYGNAVSNPST